MDWRRTAESQAGIVSRAQLAAGGVERWSVAHYVKAQRWQVVSPTVIATTTGHLSPEQARWAAVLHAGTGSMLGGLTAAEIHGLRNWSRTEITVYIPKSRHEPAPLAGARFVTTRRDLGALRSRRFGTPVCRLEPALLLFAASERSERTAIGAVAASIQQRVTSAASLLEWIERISPLRRAKVLREAIREMEGGAHSMAELDVKRMCRRFGLDLPERQVRRRDADGRLRYTDAEWRLPSGRRLVLEVDGAFHMSVENWEADVRRQRALAASDLLIVRCTARELRDEPESVANHLRAIGVPGCPRPRAL